MVSFPGIKPVTAPPDETTALPLLLLQDPPEVKSDKVTKDPAHTAEGPIIVPAVADELTVIVVAATALPQLRLTE